MIKLLAGTALAMGMAFAANAAPVTGTFPGAVSVDTPGVNIVIGTVVNLNTGVATGVGTDDLSGVMLGTGISAVGTPFTIANGSTFSFTLNGFGAFSGTTSSTNLTVNSATSRSVEFFALGDFVPTFGGFTAGPASITGAFTQTGGAAGAVSLSFTFASPPAPPPGDTPTPATLAIFGLGLAGLGFARRKTA